jgi:hypothetical protein
MLPNSSEKRKKGKKDSAESWYRERWFSIAMMLKKTMGKASEQSTAITKKYLKLATSIFLSKKDNPMQWSTTHKT